MQRSRDAAMVPRARVTNMGRHANKQPPRRQHTQGTEKLALTSRSETCLLSASKIAYTTLYGLRLPWICARTTTTEHTHTE